MIGQMSEQVREPGLRIDVVEFGALDQRVYRGGTTAAFVRAGESPVATSNRDTAQNSLGRVIRHAQTAVIEEAGEFGPAFETVIDCLGGITVRRELATLLAQPSLELGNQRPAAFI